MESWYEKQIDNQSWERVISPLLSSNSSMFQQVVPRIRTVRGQSILHAGKYFIPPGHGMYSGKEVTCAEFQYEVSEDVNMRDYPITPNDSFGSYNFADDEAFASKMKYFYSEQSRRSGRTYLMARILVEQAIETGQEIYLQDHQGIYSDRRQVDDYMMKQIREVIHQYDSQGCQIEVIKMGRDANSIILKCHNYDVYDRIRIRPYNPKRENPYVMGFDPYQKEDEDVLLLICNIK